MRETTANVDNKKATKNNKKNKQHKKQKQREAKYNSNTAVRAKQYNHKHNQSLTAQQTYNCWQHNIAQTA